MASSVSRSSEDPLLGGPSKVMEDPRSPAVSPTSQTAIKALGVIRIVTGAACIVAPRFTCALFRYPVPAEHSVLVRMFGARDAVLGELLMTAEDKRAADGGRRYA